MSIYTKTGDKGTTSLFGGKRVSKGDLQLETYGSIDELSSFIGLITIKQKIKKQKVLLTDIQKDLYQIMGGLAGANIDIVFLEGRIKLFEQITDRVQSRLPKLNRFLLPGGTELTALFHVARSVCRRSERTLVRFFEFNKSLPNVNKYRPILLQYFNRLSDLFFILARKEARGKETLV